MSLLSARKVSSLVIIMKIIVKTGFFLCLLSIILATESLVYAEPCREKFEVPLQDFVQKDAERFPPELLKEIRAGEKYWEDVLKKQPHGEAVHMSFINIWQQSCR